MYVDGKWNVWNYEWILWMGVQDDELNEMRNYNCTFITSDICI